MCTGKIWKSGWPGVPASGGRFSNVSVSLPTMRAPWLISHSAAPRLGPGEKSPL
jgi:hypothetical protein